jgi:hypothetical protein
MIETVAVFAADRRRGAGTRDATPPRIVVLGSAANAVACFQPFAAPLWLRTALPSAPADTGVQELHLRACLDHGTPEAWLHCADVLYVHRECTGEAETARALRTYPGCAVCVGAIAGERLAAAVRHRARVLLLSGSSRRRLTPAGCAAIGSALHAWLAAGHCPASLRGVGVNCDPLIRLTLIRHLQGRAVTTHPG